MTPSLTNDARVAAGSKRMLAMSQVMASCATDHEDEFRETVSLALQYWSGASVSPADLGYCLERTWNKIDQIEREAAIDWRSASKWRCVAIILQPRFSSEEEIDEAEDAFCCFLQRFMGDEYDAQCAVASFLK